MMQKVIPDAIKSSRESPRRRRLKKKPTAINGVEKRRV